jgi:hypothetical protein
MHWHVVAVRGRADLMRIYPCWGLALESELPLPLLEGIPEPAAPRVRILRGSPPAAGPGPALPYSTGGFAYGSRGDGILVRVGTVLEFFVTESTVLASGRDRDEVLGDLSVRLALGFLLQLRSMLAFHGAAACRDGAAVAVLGDKGAGKSTTAMGLARRGWSLLSDDAVVMGEGGLALPGPNRARLNADSFERLFRTAPTEADPRDRDGKLAVDPAGIPPPARLALVVALRAADVDEVSVRDIRGYGKLNFALSHMHSLEGVGDPGERLMRATAALARARVVELIRPSRLFALEEALDAVEAAAER